MSSGVITELPWREAGLTDGVNAGQLLAKVLVEEVAKDEDHVGVKVEERRLLGEEGSLVAKRVSMRGRRDIIAVGCKFDLKIFACLSKIKSRAPFLHQWGFL